MRSDGKGSTRAVSSGCLKLLNRDFNGINNDGMGVVRKAVKKRRLDVPNVAFLNAWIFFDILSYARFNCLHVNSSLVD